MRDRSLQHFAACPYRFALHGIYQLRPRDEAVPIEQMDPLTRGGLFHAVQFALLGQLKSAGLLPVNAARLDAALAHADEVLHRVAGQYEEDLAPAIPRVWQSEIEDLRTDLRGWLQHIAVNDDDWEPLHFEFAFGLPLDQGRDPASVADPANLSEAGVLLRGAIDLVERNTSTGALRVTDHKTGRPPDSAKLLANIDGAIAAGFLPPAPQKDACDFCDYRGVCGPYEERRFASVKERRDERLEPLIEIRGMG